MTGRGFGARLHAMGSVRGLFGWAVLLTLATGLIHLYIGVDFLLVGPYADAVIDPTTRTPVGFVFIGMAIPYLVGLALILGGVRPHLWLRVGAGYTALLLVLWAVAGTRDKLAYADKAIEIALLVLIVALIRRPVESAV